MPLYEYACGSCDDTFAVLQKMGAGATGLTYPECGGRDLERQHSPFAGRVVSSGSSQTGTSDACRCGSPGGCGA